MGSGSGQHTRLMGHKARKLVAVTPAAVVRTKPANFSCSAVLLACVTGAMDGIYSDIVAVYVGKQHLCVVGRVRWPSSA